jgi:hypothetical protein
VLERDEELKKTMSNRQDQQAISMFLVQFLKRDEEFIKRTTSN